MRQSEAHGAARVVRALLDKKHYASIFAKFALGTARLGFVRFPLRLTAA